MDRRLKIAAVLLLTSQVTCVDHKPPTSSEPIIRTEVLTRAVITQTRLTSGNDVNNLRVYTTASIAPAPNALVTVAVLTHQSSAAAPAPTLTGGGMASWELVATVAYNGSTPLDRVSIFRAMSASPGSGPITITSSATVSNCQWIVSQWEGVETTGANGSGAIVQTGSTTGAAVTGLTVSLASFADAANAAYGVFGIANSSPIATAGSGFTAIDEVPSSESSPGDLFAEWAFNDNTINATWSSKAAGALGVEIAAGIGGGGPPPPPPPPPPVSASMSTVSAAPTSIAVGSGTSTITVTAKDASGNPISGATVALSATGTGNTLTQPAAATNASGVATGTITSTDPGSKVVTAQIDGTTITQTATVTVTTGGVSAALSTVTASPASVAPGATSTVTVTAKDANGNPISGATVVLAATGTASVTQPAGPTNANGVASGSVSSTEAGAHTVSATIDGTAITQTATVTVVAPTTATITQTLLTAGRSASNTRTYTTASISPAANALITVAVLMERPSGVRTPSLSGGGMSTWTLVSSVDFATTSSPDMRLMIFRAMSANPGSGTLTITFSSSPDNAMWIVSQWDGVETGGTNGSAAIVQTGSQRSNGATNLTVSLAAFASANNVAYGVVGVARNGPTVSPGSGFTEISEQSSGEASDLAVEWASNQPTVRASWGSSVGAAVLGVEIKAGAGSGGGGVSASLSTVSAAPTSIAVGSGSSTITVTAKDASGNPLSGATVVLSATGTGNTLTQPAATTNASGVATGTITSTVPGSKTVTAQIDGTTITQTATVTVTAGSVSASQSTVAASPTSVAPGVTSTITVTAKDSLGDPVSGATVVLTATGTGNTLTQPPDTTDANGVATGTISSTVAGTKTVTAKINGTTITQTATVTVTPGPVSAAQSTVAASPASVAPGANATVTVTAKDDFGNSISGATVTLAGSGTANVTQPAAPTDATGVASGSVSSLTEGPITVSAAINGTAITQTATVSVVASHSSGPITPTLLTSGHDVNNLRIYTTASIAPSPNALVTVAVLMHQSASAVPAPTLTGGGMASWDLVATVAYNGATPLDRVAIFRAMSASPGSGPITITSSATASNCQWIVSQWTGVETSGVNGAGAIVQTGSSTGAAVTGLTVPLAGFAAAANVAYGAFGIASATPIATAGSGFTAIDQQGSGESTIGDLFAEWAVNDNTIDAAWPSKAAGALGVEIKAGGHSDPVVPVASVEVTPATADVSVGSTAQLTAILKDAVGEPIDGRPITWSSNAPQFATVSSTGLVTGVAVGTATITATSEGISGSASITVTSNSAAVASVTVTPASSIVPPGGTTQLTATTRDAQGNVLTGRSITWATGAPGVATVSSTGLVTGVATGTATITATSEGIPGSASVTVTGGGAATLGQWSSVIASPVIQVHQSLLLNGQVLIFGGSSAMPWVFDPATGLFTEKPISEIMFCSGHSWLPDGRLLVSGGGSGNGLGHFNTDIFDPATASWITGPDMRYARWYPTVTTMPNGEVVTMGGADQNGNAVPIPEIGNGTSWRSLTGASLTLPNYPRNFVAPDGRLFVAGPQRQSYWLNVSGSGSFSDGPSMNFGSRVYGSAVMYDAGKILFVGGNSSPTNTAEIIDLNQANPAWSFTNPMTKARWNLNATVLPDGQVLVTGGVSGDRSNASLKVNTTEMWNPANGTWTTLASSASLLRGYHSTTLLLPDGRLIHAGGGAGGGTVDNLNYEIYSPPYLFRGARPSVTGVTGTPGYGQVVTVQTPDGASITKVNLIRFGSVTHAYDEGQRLVPLTFSQTADGISVNLPSSRNNAPPGPYMLFLVNNNGVPSIGQIMRLQ